MFAAAPPERLAVLRIVGGFAVVYLVLRLPVFLAWPMPTLIASTRSGCWPPWPAD